MKKIGILLFLLSIIFSACKKESQSAYEVEKVFPDAGELFSEFKKTIANGQSIWKGTLSPKSGKVYSLYMSLNDKGVVDMLADLDPETGIVSRKGKFSLRSEKTNAIISFSEGTYLDSMYVKKGREIIAADTSYSFSYKKGDTVMLIGNRYGDELKLVYASVEERNAYNAGELGRSLISVSEFFSKKPFYSVITANGYGVQFAINQFNRSVIASYVDKNEVRTVSIDFAYGINQILFKKPVKFGNNWVYELFFDPLRKVFYMQDGAQKISFIGSNRPVIPLHYFMGNGFPPELSVPSPHYIEELPGWSSSFYYAWTVATSRLNYSPYKGFLLVADFDFSSKNKIMNLNLYFDINSKLYQGTFPFSYTKTSDGIYTFTALPLDTNLPEQDNASVIKPYVEPVTSIMTGGKFKLDYYESPNELLGQFIGVDDPQMFFTGHIGSIVK